MPRPFTTPCLQANPTPRLRAGRRATRRATACLVAGGMLAMSAPSADTPPHHRGDRFQNNYLEFEPRGLGDLVRWRWDAFRNDLPAAPQHATPSVRPDLAFLRTNAVAGAVAMEPAFTWVGHATLLAQIGGLNILTDPVFSERASPLSFIGPKRQLPPGLALDELPHVDLVLISHNHYDHLDDASVRALARQAGGPPLYLVPLGLKRWFEARGITTVVELDWWQSHPVATDAGPVEIALTPVQHWSGRGLGDRMQTLWGGYAVFAPDFQFYFAGDTAYSKDFADIRARYAERQTPEAGGGFDLAAIPVGAYEPRWFMRQQHVDPAEAVQVHADLGAKRSVGIHWGTFQLTDEALDVPPQALADVRRARALPEDRFFVLAVGETRRLPRRRAAPPAAAALGDTSDASAATGAASGAAAASAASGAALSGRN